MTDRRPHPHSAPAKYVSQVQCTRNSCFAGSHRLGANPWQSCPFVGGHPALDFVNTAEERGHPEAGDVLQTPADLAPLGRSPRSARRRRLRAPTRPPSLPARSPRASSSTSCSSPAPKAAKHSRTSSTRLAGLAADAHAATRIVEAADGSLTLEWDRSQLASIRHAVVVGAFELLADAPNGRLKQCPGDRCGWLFLDTTKRGNRRWCSMAECGQDAKSAGRRARSALDTRPRRA